MSPGDARPDLQALELEKMRRALHSFMEASALNASPARDRGLKHERAFLVHLGWRLGIERGC